MTGVQTCALPIYDKFGYSGIPSVFVTTSQEFENWAKKAYVTFVTCMTAVFTEKSSVHMQDVLSSLGQCLVLVWTFVHNLLTSCCGLGLQKSVFGFLLVYVCAQV